MRGTRDKGNCTKKAIVTKATCMRPHCSPLLYGTRLLATVHSI